MRNSLNDFQIVLEQKYGEVFGDTILTLMTGVLCCSLIKEWGKTDCQPIAVLYERPEDREQLFEDLKIFPDNREFIMNPKLERELAEVKDDIAFVVCGTKEEKNIERLLYAAEMGISLFSEINRYTLEDAKVELFYHLQVAGGSYERIPMGIFEVSEANRKAKCLEIKAYDYMVRFEKAFTSLESIGNAYDFMVLCSTACDVTLAQDRATIEAMPNGTENLSIYSDNDIETYRDVLFYVGQVLGGFFVINRAGELELRKYGNTPVLTVERKHRFTSSFSDFITRYTAVSSTNLRTQIAEYYALDPDDGLTMNLGVNPLLQFGLEETRRQLCENILNDLAVVNYVPFDSDTIGNPALDVGDVLSFSGGQADATKYACITSNSIKIGGRQSIKCVGKNPKLSQAKSKNDKNISGLLAQIEAGKIGIHTFTNASAFSVADVDTKIISIEFATTEANHAQFFGQVIVDVTAQPVTRSVTASGDVVIPSVNVDGVPVNPEDPEEEPVVIGSTEEQTITVSLPMSWQEDGHDAEVSETGRTS